jgi:release factor H-coupled RctB family protein
MRAAVGLPDLHPGKGYPIGAVFLSERIYPALVGNDIGCGMALWQTELTIRRFKPERAAERLQGLEGPWDGDLDAWRADWNLEPTPFDTALGTIGGGNHFAELQAIDRYWTSRARRPGSGPRAPLPARPQRFARTGRVDPARPGRPVGTCGSGAGQPGGRGLSRPSRSGAALGRGQPRPDRQRLLDALGTEAEQRLAVWHNGVEPVDWHGERLWLHRKGAAPADRGPLVIPGSRGSLSYLVAPTGDGETSLHSLAHGAGRKWKRGEARARLSGRQRPEDLAVTALGGQVICEDKELLYDEAPESYKGIERVIGDLVAAGLCHPIATLRPVLTYKVRRAEHQRPGRARQTERRRR